MNPTLTIILCGLGLFAATEADVICGSGELDNTRCMNIKKCEPIINRLRYFQSKNSNEREAYNKKVRNLKCYLATDNDKDIGVCCPVQQPKQGRCGDMSEDKFPFSDSTANPLDYPWVALLEYKTPRGTEVHCGGVLISNRHVLTAASCLETQYPLVSVRLGEYNLTTDIDSVFDDGDHLPKYASIGIAKKKAHEKYSLIRGANSDFVQDTDNIAILTLARSVATQPICLPTLDPKSYKNFRALGWGTQTDKEPKFQVKSQVMMRNSTCHLYAEKTICVEARNKTYGCAADEGGPLMQRERSGDGSYVVLGIFAPESIDPCRIERKPYTNVFKYKDWISKNMR